MPKPLIGFADGVGNGRQPCGRWDSANQEVSCPSPFAAPVPRTPPPLRDLTPCPRPRPAPATPFASLHHWQQRLEPRDGVTVLVAESDGLVVGNLTLWQEPNPRRRHGGPRYGGARRLGPGAAWARALMAAAIDLADNWLGLTLPGADRVGDNGRRRPSIARLGSCRRIAREYGMRATAS